MTALASPPAAKPAASSIRSDVRNVAIIAHVDHGKTTLVDALLRQSGNFRESQLSGDMILDSNPLERERGITILSKNIAITHTADDGTRTKINLIDTPGHADFGGEVERVLAMADGCFLLVDSAEGPMPQTRFVLGKALKLGLRPIVLINKMDRPDRREDKVLDEIFDLFVELEADESQLDFPVLYGTGRAGKAALDPEAWDAPDANIRPVFDAILSHVPPPEADMGGPLKLRIQTIQYSEYVGRIGVGRIYGGGLRSGQAIKLIGRSGTRNGRVTQLQVFEGFGRTDAAEAHAGDIVALVGLDGIEIGDSVCDVDNPTPMPQLEIEPPTLTMTFRVNDSPFAGKEGKYVTGRNIRDRLFKELESNVALKVEATGDNDALEVSGRGLLHLGILLETMRRESYELSVGKPKVVMTKENGVLMEPVERLVVDVPEAAMGPVMELVGFRRGNLEKMDQRGGITHLEFLIPARGLIGLKSRLLTATAGEANMHHTYHGHQAVRGDVPGRQQGVMIANGPGTVTAYALDDLQQRGILFVSPGDAVYEGMIVGEHCRENDIVVNVTRAKQLTNFRTTSKDDAVMLKPAWRPTLEQALEYIEDDELVEVTPSAIRIRKVLLKEADRKRADRKAAKSG